MGNPFREEHEHFRQTVRKFAEKELAPHVEEWEKDEIFPNWVFKRAGELGIFGAHYPEELGARAATTGSASRRARSCRAA
jgi:citronellyl-CoA dehydrogenase